MTEDHPRPALGRAGTTVLGFPRIDRDREVKSALEAHWFQRDARAVGRSGADMITNAHHGALRVAIELHEDVVLVALTGPLDIYTVPGFRRDIGPHADAGDQIVIDLTEVTLIDSSGLGALVSLRNQAHRDGPGSLGPVCPQRHLLRVFEVTGLRRAFRFVPAFAPASASRSGNAGARPLTHRPRRSVGADGDARAS